MTFGELAVAGSLEAGKVRGRIGESLMGQAWLLTAQLLRNDGGKVSAGAVPATPTGLTSILSSDSPLRTAVVTASASSSAAGNGFSGASR